MAFDEQALAEALRLLEDARELEPDDARYLALERAAAFLTKSAKKKRRLRRKQRSRAADQALPGGGGIDCRSGATKACRA